MAAAPERDAQHSISSLRSNPTANEGMTQRVPRRERRENFWMQHRPARDPRLEPPNLSQTPTSVNRGRYFQEVQDPQFRMRDNRFYSGQHHVADGVAYRVPLSAQGTTTVQRHVSTRTVEELRPQGLLQLWEARSTTSYMHGCTVMRREVSSDLTWTESTGSRSIGPPSPITPASELAESNTSYPFLAHNVDHMGTQFGGAAGTYLPEANCDGSDEVAVLPGQNLTLLKACPAIQVTGVGDDDLDDLVNVGNRNEAGELDVDIVAMLMPECSISAGLVRAETFPLTKYHSNPDLVTKRKKVPDDLALLEPPSTSHTERLAALAEDI